MGLYEKMNEYLANQQIMYIKLHNIHWNVEGKSFFVLHEKTEELYNQTAEIIDEVAERLLALGQRPVASLKRALEIAKVEELPNEAITTEKAMHHLIVDVEYWLKDTKELIALAEEAGDQPTADIFIGYLSQYQKLKWMLNAYNK